MQYTDSGGILEVKSVRCGFGVAIRGKKEGGV